MSETMAKIKLPPYQPPTSDELAERKKLIAQTISLREKIGPVKTRVEDLIREDREGH